MGRLNVREDIYNSIYKSKTLEGFIPALNQSVTFKVKKSMLRVSLQR
jgi:HlyD family secretion protein